MADHESLISKLDAALGTNEIGAMGILTLSDVHLDALPSSEAFYSGQGLCPGNNQSASKRHGGILPVRKHPLKALFIGLTWAATKTKGSYYREIYHRLKARRGGKRAVTHKLAKAVYHIIKHGVPYRELGRDYLDRTNQSAKFKGLRAQATAMGFILTPQPI